MGASEEVHRAAMVKALMANGEFVEAMRTATPREEELASRAASEWRDRVLDKAKLIVGQMATKVCALLTRKGAIEAMLFQACKRAQRWLLSSDFEIVPVY